MKSNTIVAEQPSGKPFGSRKDVLLKKLFATSPLYANPNSASGIADVPGYSEKLRLTESDLRTWFFQNVVDTDGAGVPSSGDYYGANGSYSMNFDGVQGNGPPDMKAVSANETGGAGKPATAFVPNPASPGADPSGGTNFNYETIPASPEFAATLPKNPDSYGSGEASTSDSRNPSVTSAKIGKSANANLTLGRSLATPR